MTALRLADIAPLIGRDYQWLARKANRRKLYARGFPRPMDVPGRPVWDAAAVRGWQEKQRGQSLTAPLTPPRAAINLAAHRDALSARLAG